MEYTLVVNGQTSAAGSAEELDQQLEAIRGLDNTELWLHAENGAALCVLANRDDAWLMFLQDEDDAGFSSRNPHYASSPDTQLAFVLSNGQRDLYPAHWCIDKKSAFEAVRYFLIHGEKPPWIEWHDDTNA